MRFVGLDLAWGSNGGTGLCFVEDNKVVESGFARTDEEIIERLRSVTSEPCLVAIDAPLVISNKTGRRECERAISRCFGKHHAGAHSSNLGMSAFINGSRGARLCSQLSLEMDPEIAPLVPTRRAIEVYPHPALVALFALPLTLKYKAKRGRSIDQRIDAFEVLCELLESLHDATPRLQVRNPRWVQIREMLSNTTSGAELDRLEDELDAYICAYIALYYWTHGSDRCRVVGSASAGYIVTPVSPDHARVLDAIGREH